MGRFFTPSALIAGGLGLLIAGSAWTLALRERLTGPHRVEWRGPDDRPLALDLRNYACEGARMHEAFVHDRRVVVPCYSSDHPTGLAWIDPGKGVAKIAWAVPRPMRYLHTQGLALRADGSFGLAFTGMVDRTEILGAGIAGRDGWLTPPVVVATEPDDRRGGARLLAMAWMGDALELVMTRPQGKQDPYDIEHAPEIVRLRPGQPVERALHPVALRHGDSLVFALPTPRGWDLAISQNRDGWLSDPQGAISARPGAWWGDYGEHFNADLSALGLSPGSLTPDSPIVELDGTRHAPAPVPGFVPATSFERHQLVGGVLRTKRLWSPDQDRIGLLAQVVGDRTLFAATAPDDRDVQLVGDHPDRMHPVIRERTSSSFSYGEFLPAPGGYFWVSGEGEYVTLDRELRRTDPLSLSRHLRTRGTSGAVIDEPTNVWQLGWALFGLPILALPGLLGSWWARRSARRGRPPELRVSPLGFSLWLFVVTGGLALHRVYPLL